MELLSTEDAASVILFQLRCSEGTLQTLASALGYLLDTLSADELHKVLLDEEWQEQDSPEETRQDVEMVYVQLMDLIKGHCRPEFLSERFRNWKLSER